MPTLELRILADQIQDATLEGENTATRVGTFLNSDLDYEEQQDLQISTNAANIGLNITQIGVNSAGIAQNVIAIAAIDGASDQNTANIAANAADILANTALINTNIGDISTNQSNISGNTSDIATNVSDIATNVGDIETNALDITTLEGNRLLSVQAGLNVTVDNSDPLNPIVAAAGGGGITDAPSDGNLYGRRNEAWAIVPAAGVVDWGEITGTLSNQADLQNALDTKYDDSNPDNFISGIAWGGITGTLSDQTDLQNSLDSKLSGFTVGNSQFVSIQNVGTATVPDITALLSATGTPDGTTFLRGDNTWAVPPAGGTINGSIAAGQIAFGATTADEIEGNANLTFDGNNLTVSGGKISTTDGTLEISANDVGAARFNKIATMYVPDLPPNLATEQHWVQLAFGKEATTNNQAEFSFVYWDDNNTLNTFRMGLFNTNVLDLKGDGNARFWNSLEITDDLTVLGTINGANLSDKLNSVTTGEPTGSAVLGNAVQISQTDFDNGTPVAGTLYAIV